MADLSVSSHTKSILIQGQELILLPEKAIFWQDQSMLILTDLHLGKAGHFRKAGIPIPSGVHEADLLCLQKLINSYPVRSVLMLGDLFHSEINTEWNDFRLFLDDNASLSFILVKGNHDILPTDAYREKNLIVHEEDWCLPPFHFSHHPLEKGSDQLYNMAGHIHPGYCLKSRRGDRIKLPSFHISARGILLPSFGKFTGCVHIPKKKGDQVFIILPSNTQHPKVMQV